MKTSTLALKTLLLCCALTVACNVAKAQTIVPVYDLGTNSNGSLVLPTPGPLDITNFNPAADTQFPDGLNYYEDNGGALNPGGQTFTAPSSNTVLTSVSLQMGLDNGVALGYGGLGPGVFWLRIYAVTNQAATLIASYNTTNTFTFNAGDWLQWTGLKVPLEANGVYAYTFAKDPSVGGWCQIYAGSGDTYSGGEICLIQAAGGSTAVTYGTLGTYDGNFDIGISPLTKPVAGPPVASPGTTVYGGTPVTLTENAGGVPPFTYQWQTDNGSGGAMIPISGGTSSNYVFNAPTMAGSFAYNVIVSNSEGSDTSSVVTITVNAPAILRTQDIAPGTNVWAYENGTVNFNAAFDGSQPITYQWTADTGGGPVVVGSNTNTLPLGPLQMSDAGSYQVSASNIAGSTNSSTAVLTVMSDPPAPTPSAAYAYAIMTNNPVAYWRLNDPYVDNTAISLQAYDFSGNNHNGTYGSGAVSAVDPGPSYPGFESGISVPYFINNAANSYISVQPDLDLNTNTVTITAWINPQVGIVANTGILMWRGANGDAAGLSFGANVNSSGVAELGYVWNTNSPATYNYNSALYPPLNTWSFVALTITPTNSTIYLYYMQSSVTYMLKSAQTITNYAELFNGGTLRIASDNYDGRDFYGDMAEVAVFAHSLSETQIQSLFLTALGTSSAVPQVATQPSDVATFVGQTIQLTANGGGAPPPSYQWQKAASASGPWSDVTDDSRISGATTATLVVSDTAASDAGYYRLHLQNSAGSADSNPAHVTLISVPSNGQWTVNFAVTTVNNGAPGTAYVGPGILGSGTYWNVLTGGLYSNSTSYRDDGATPTGIQCGFTNYPGSWASPQPYNNQLLDTFATVGGATGATNAFDFTSVPNGVYNLAVYSCAGSYANRSAIITVQGQSMVLSNRQDRLYVSGDNTALFTNLTITNGTLEIVIQADTNAPQVNANWEGEFNGAQLQNVSLFAPPTVMLTNSWDGSNLTLSWSQGILLQSTNVAGPWVTNAAAAPPSFTIQPDPNEPTMFYKVQVQ